MLSFDIRTLESKAAQVHDDLPADDPVWDAADAAPSGPVHVDGRLSAAGDGRFYFSGHISGSVQMDCRRCLVPVPTEVKEDAHFFFAPEGDATAEDDPDVYLYDPGIRQLDLRPAVRESWLLAVPAFVQCRPDCKGLCPQCGTDLNVDTCPCVPAATDSRWNALRNATHDQSRS